MRLIVALVLALVACDGDSDRKTIKVGIPAHTEGLPRLFGSKVTRIEIDGQHRAVLDKGDGTWRVLEPYQAPARVPAVEGALLDLSRLEWSAKPVATDRASWERLGVAEGQAVTVTVTHDGQVLPPIHLGVGHARIGDAPAVFEIYRAHPLTFDKEPERWREQPGAPE
jgi:hypothetical protein